MQRLILAEPGLKGSTGHEHAHSRVLAVECARRGFGFELLASAHAADAATAGLPARKVFRVSVYARAPEPGRMATLKAVRAWSRKFRKDFERALDSLQVGPDDVLLLNTVKVPVLVGIDRWLSRTPRDLRPSLAVILRLGAEEGLPDGLMPDLSRWLYRHILNRLYARLGPRLLLASDTRLIGEEFERLTGRPVAPIPLPINVPQPTPPDCSSDAIHLVFPSSGVSRGFHLLPEALASAFARNPRLTATVRAPLHIRGGEKIALEQLGRMTGKIRLIEGALDEPAFYDMLSDAGAILLSYDPEVFAKRSSQILAQSAALGRPVIVVAGTFLERECRDNGIVSVTAEAFTSEALADAIDRFVRRRERLAHAAWDACPMQRRRHSAAEFMERLVEFSETARASASALSV